jgi:protein ImuB
VCTLAPRAEHRPEHAWTSAAVADAGKVAGVAGTTRGKPPYPAQSPHARPRPAWLLERPRALITRDAQPLHHGPLTLLAGPERIQSGWWDNRPVARDYFVARNPLGETCWIYRELSASRRWFLHGVFG